MPGVKSRFIPHGSADTLVNAVLKDAFEGTGVHVGTLYSASTNPPIILARRERRSGTVANAVQDRRFLDPVILAVETITEGRDADREGEELQEAARLALTEAWADQRVVPDGGSINWMSISSIPSRVADWATSTGVQQYASLPKGYVRYESIYRMLIRPPHPSTITNRFIDRDSLTSGR